MWKFIRISVLLVVLVIVAGTTWLDKARTTEWKQPLRVGIFPMSADGSEAAARYIARLTADRFADIEEFFRTEGARYGIDVPRGPVRIGMFPAPDRLPPVLEPGSGPLATAWWSLRMRWYASRADDVPNQPEPHIRLFVLYHDPARNDRVPHSLGLQKGLLGLVHAFADAGMHRQNNIVIAHEAMHTLGATDRYDPETGAPLFPDGYAEPEREPRFPQRATEIMAGRRPLSASEHEMPESLRAVVVGRRTAMEIGWLKP